MTHSSNRKLTEEYIDTESELTRRELTVSWALRLIAAGIMLETLFFKFTGAKESIWIFTQMNMESWGRYGQGLWELSAAVLLLFPGTVWMGCLLTLGAMGAALLSHLVVLGISIMGDHGVLFGMACTVFTSSLITLWLHQRSVPFITPLNDYPR